MNDEIKKSFGYKFIESQDRFFKSKWSFITFTLAVVAFAILQILLFLTTNFEVQNTNDPSSWQAWLYMMISPIGATLSLIGYVYTVRVDKKFFIPAVIGQSITLVNSFLSGMIWTGFVMFFIIGMGVWRLLLIHSRGPNYRLNNRSVYLIGGD